MKLGDKTSSCSKMGVLNHLFEYAHHITFFIHNLQSVEPATGQGCFLIRSFYNLFQSGFPVVFNLELLWQLLNLILLQSSVVDYCSLSASLIWALNKPVWGSFSNLQYFKHRVVVCVVFFLIDSFHIAARQLWLYL